MEPPPPERPPPKPPVRPEDRLDEEERPKPLLERPAPLPKSEFSVEPMDVLELPLDRDALLGRPALLARPGGWVNPP